MDYHLTTTVKKSGGSSLCIYVLAAWKLEVGTEMNVEVRRADGTDNDPVFTYISTLRSASTTGGQKITIPKFFGFNVGDWVTIILSPIRTQE